MLLALFTILLGGLASCEIYHVNFEHVYDVDSASVPSLHQKEFISSLMQNDRRRSLLEQAGFFRLHGVSSSDGTEHEFLMKAAMQHRFQVRTFFRKSLRGKCLWSFWQLYVHNRLFSLVVVMLSKRTMKVSVRFFVYFDSSRRK